MEEKKNILTYQGLRKYEDELHDLKVVKRQEVAQKIKEAREQGDLSENAEYDAAMISLTCAEQKSFDYIKGDSEGFVNIPLSIKNVCFTCFLREDTERPVIKISLRSIGTFPCNQFAAEFFNGGGHLNASGGEFYGTMEEAVKVFEQGLEKYKSLLCTT